jgi:hypothetical protein
MGAGLFWPPEISEIKNHRGKDRIAGGAKKIANPFGGQIMHVRYVDDDGAEPKAYPACAGGFIQSKSEGKVPPPKALLKSQIRLGGRSRCAVELI